VDGSRCEIFWVPKLSLRKLQLVDQHMNEVELPSRTLSLTLKQVDLIPYRRVRVSSGITGSPPHLEYVLRCDWTGEQQPRSGALEFSPTSTPRRNLCPIGTPWWDLLPSSYIIRRRWSDIAGLHRSVQTELAFDNKLGCRRVKAPVPQMPSKGQSDDFLLGIAVTGDCLALHRPCSWTSPNMAGEATSNAREDLQDMHTFYLEKRLAPYFASINKVLQELPADALYGADTLRKFVSYGAQTLARKDPMVVPFHNFGPNPLRATPQDIAAVAQALKSPAKHKGGKKAQRDTSTLTSSTSLPALSGSSRRSAVA